MVQSGTQNQSDYSCYKIQICAIKSKKRYWYKIDAFDALQITNTTHELKRTNKIIPNTSDYDCKLTKKS